VGSWRKENADDLSNNPFLEDLLEWRDSPEGQQFSELADALCGLIGGRASRCRATPVYLA
jgi:hypothetical protein